MTSAKKAGFRFFAFLLFYKQAFLMLLFVLLALSNGRGQNFSPGIRFVAHLQFVGYCLSRIYFGVDQSFSGNSKNLFMLDCTTESVTTTCNPMEY